jgi:hypothetical protein
MSSSRVYRWNDDERNVHDFLPSSANDDDIPVKPVYVILKEMYDEEKRNLYNISWDDSDTRDIDCWIDYDYDYDVPTCDIDLTYDLHMKEHTLVPLQTKEGKQTNDKDTSSSGDVLVHTDGTHSLLSN